jgi:hypothetical protein
MVSATGSAVKETKAVNKEGNRPPSHVIENVIIYLISLVIYS